MNVLTELKSLVLFFTAAFAVLFAGAAVESGSMALAGMAAVAALMAAAAEAIYT